MAELGEKPTLIRRFYKTVDIDAHEDGFILLLDGRRARTRAGRALTCAREALAQVIAQEWRAVGDHIDFARMPRTRLRMTVIDRADDDRGSWAGIVLNFLDTDLLVYRADRPEGLTQRQAAAWDPILAALGRATGILLHPTAGIAYAAQPPENAARAEALLAAVSDDALLCVKELTELLGSAALALAHYEKLIGVDAAFEASRIDEEFQIEQWGRDSEADAAMARKRADYDAVCDYLSAL